MSRTVLLLAGPSGSGKSRLARVTGCPLLALDDFYFPGDHPDLPTRRLGGHEVVDWDDVRSWNLAEALATIVDLARTGVADVPVYRISDNARTGTRRLDLGPAAAVLAEGVFAPDLYASCTAAGLTVEPLWLDRPRALTAVLRFTRDVREHRKPMPVLVRRGLALASSEPALRAAAIETGFRPVSFLQARQVVEQAMQPGAETG